jgi:glucokinase
MSHTIGLDIGGTKVLGVLLDADGNITREARQASPHTGLDALVATSTLIVDELRTADEPIGVGVAGLVDGRGGVGYSPNLPQIRDAPVGEALAAATAHRVIVDNDANVAALAESTYGATRGVRHALLVTLGTGIGGGLTLNGCVYRGAHDYAGEIGHFTVDPNGPMCACGERGHWEAIASGSALGRMARELGARGGGSAIVDAAGGDLSAVRGVHVAEAAAQGNSDALALLAQYADNIALGLAGLANVLDPERIVVAGGIVELGPLLFGPLRDAFRRHVEGSEYRRDVTIVPAQLGEHAGAVGAAILARDLAAP